MLDKLSRTDRLRLMKFICSFAWADLEVHEKERSFVKRMIKKLQLDEDEAAQVRGLVEQMLRLLAGDTSLLPELAVEEDRAIEA